jgi:putative transposase
VVTQDVDGAVRALSNQLAQGGRRPYPLPTDNPFKRFNSSPEIIRLAVMMYVRYPLSLRKLEDLLAERGIDICHKPYACGGIVLGRCSRLRSRSGASFCAAVTRSGNVTSTG